MNIELEQLPTLNCDHNSAVYTYLRDVLNDSSFVTPVLQTLIKERRTSHRNRWNKNSVEKLSKVDDIVKAHLQVQSITDKGIVEKYLTKIVNHSVLPKFLV